MELRQLRHFLALVEERSVTRAAKRELIVQSGLSNSLQALERELGTALYVRGTRPVRLTAAGEALVGPARRTVTSAAQAEEAVHHTRDVLIGTLRLGVSLSAQHLVPFASYLGEFTRGHPGIDLRLHYAPALTMISMLEAGELDCVIGPAVSQVPGVRMTRLAREPLHLVCRADHRLAERTEVNVGQLADERFVEVPPGWTARLLSDAAFTGEGIQRRVVCEVGDWELFLELVSAGVGIGFAPVGLQYPVLTAPDSVLRLIAVEGVHLERHIYLMLPSAGETSPAARQFADQLLRIHPAGS
ncbi:LysR family transcriptional regulator [Streptomyces sp. NPDC048417]|uniref:LysR family transcriptional regulator n=1 Tax=Streptomyces sp. NPDC048417 TaxID=3155387 RepID=UPI0034288F65